MNTIKIPFSGITRNTDDGTCPDGDCMELINARIVNGSVEPISKPIELAAYPSKYKAIYFHSAVKKYIFITESGTLEWKQENFAPGGTLGGVKSVQSVNFVGNTMVAITNEGMRYFLHKNDAYYYLGELPELPIVYVGSEAKTFTSEAVTVKASTGASRNEIKKMVYEQVYGLFLKLQKQANKETYFVNGTLIRMAFRLYDGTYVKHSPIIFTPQNAEALKQQVTLNGKVVTLDPLNKFCTLSLSGDLEDPKTVEYTIHCAIIAIKPTFQSIFVIPQAWRDVILSLDIFASFNISHPLPFTDPLFYEANPDYEKPNPLKELTETYKFYKFASVDSADRLQCLESNVSKDSLALCDTLTDDNGSNHSVCPTSSYVYNARLHVWGIKTKLFSWYDPMYLKAEENTYPHTADIYVNITTNNGEMVLHRQGMIYGDKISGIIMYPDYRATKITICIDNKRYKAFNLTRHSHLNAAVYFNTDNKGMLNTIDTLAWPAGTPSISATSSIDESNNTNLMVSELNNPFFFPPKNVYTFQTNIVAVQSNTVALSQGQFGQYPLYVFCKDGIFAMSTGTSVGDSVVAYSASTPVSRDVAIIPYVAGVDSAVAFLSDRGALFISGAQVQCVSNVLDGYLPSCVISSPIVPKVMQVAKMGAMLSSVVFRDYCVDAKIGYNYQQSEVIVANPDYPYSYVFNMKSNTWHKIDLKIHFFINAYPNTYVFASKGPTYAIYDLNNNHRSVSTMALLSRPIKMGSNSHKRILQTALRGIVKRALSDLYLRGEPVMFRGQGIDIFSDVGFYILGSNDAEHFILVSAKEAIVDLRDLVTKMNKSKAYKYFMICLVGGVRSDVSLNYVEAIADESYDNRLR